MNLKKIGILVATLILACGSALAWNCSDPLASRIDVGQVNPGGTSGDGDGQWFLGTGSEGVKGDYYVCQVPKNNSGGSATNTNTNTNQNNNTQSQQQGQSQGQTANGGSSTSNATGGQGG